MTLKTSAAPVGNSPHQYDDVREAATTWNDAPTRDDADRAGAGIFSQAFARAVSLRSCHATVADLLRRPRLLLDGDVIAGQIEDKIIG